MITSTEQSLRRIEAAVDQVRKDIESGHDRHSRTVRHNSILQTIEIGLILLLIGFDVYQLAAGGG